MEVYYRSLSDAVTRPMISTGVVGWVTQLVVDASDRERYIATLLLQTLKIHPLFHDITAIGLVSSHPAACNALFKYASKHPAHPPIEFLTNECKMSKSTRSTPTSSVNTRGRSSVSLLLSTSRITRMSSSVETFLRIVHLALFRVHTQSTISIIMSH